MSETEKIIERDGYMLEQLVSRMRTLHEGLRTQAHLSDVLIGIAFRDCLAEGSSTCIGLLPDVPADWCPVCTARVGCSTRYFHVPEDIPCGHCGTTILKDRPAIYGTDGVLYGYSCDCDLTCGIEAEARIQP